jgi:hypothetical protein
MDRGQVVAAIAQAARVGGQNDGESGEDESNESCPDEDPGWNCQDAEPPRDTETAVYQRAAQQVKGMRPVPEAASRS